MEGERNKEREYIKGERGREVERETERQIDRQTETHNHIQNIMLHIICKG